MPAGSHEIKFIATDLTNTVLLHHSEAGKFQEVRKIKLLK